MRNPTDQASCFILLAKLFCYLASGKSHVGYLSNNPRNVFVYTPQVVISFPPKFLIVDGNCDVLASSCYAIFGQCFSRKTIF